MAQLNKSVITLIALLIPLVALLAVCPPVLANDYGPTAQPANAERPNMLWLSIEDIGPHLGCYDDPDAVTPNLYQFAKRSLCYDLAWSNFPVCAPARTTIICGMYASVNAAGNMRSNTLMPKGVDMFPHYLRGAGYYCTNSSKEDYNYEFNANVPWDESSRKAHWKNRSDGQPFFSVFNYTGTHESKIRVRPHTQVIDPATVHLPAYWPDTPEVRQDWAQYHDNITKMDKWIQRHLKALDDAGLSDDTIVVVFGDHGSGMPRHKRFAGDSGMRVPFIVHVPEKLKNLAPDEYVVGGRTKRPVGFVDLAPTMLSAVGIRPPGYMQGNAFLGEFETAAPKYVYGFRDRMDERPDISRAIRDERFIYVRNYMPHLPSGQVIGYQLETPASAVWKKMFDEGKLNEIQSQFWSPRAPEEFYDLTSDPEETKNLVSDPAFQDELSRFRAEHDASAMKFGDLGLIPESIAYQFEHNIEGQRFRSRRMMLDDKENFPLPEIFHIAGHAANFDEGSIPELVTALESDCASLRYWGAMGLMIRGQTAVEASLEKIETLSTDSVPAVAIVACESMARFGDADQKKAAADLLVALADQTETDYYASIHALNAVERLDKNIGFPKEVLGKLPSQPNWKGRGSSYVRQLLDSLLK